MTCFVEENHRCGNESTLKIFTLRFPQWLHFYGTRLRPTTDPRRLKAAALASAASFGTAGCPPPWHIGWMLLHQHSGRTQHLCRYQNPCHHRNSKSRFNIIFTAISPSFIAVHHQHRCNIAAGDIFGHQATRSFCVKPESSRVIQAVGFNRNNVCLLTMEYYGTGGCL